jgi:hypothetical protein
VRKQLRVLPVLPDSPGRSNVTTEQELVFVHQAGIAVGDASWRLEKLQELAADVQGGLIICRHCRQNPGPQYCSLDVASANLVGCWRCWVACW